MLQPIEYHTFVKCDRSMLFEDPQVLYLLEAAGDSLR